MILNARQVVSETKSGQGGIARARENQHETPSAADCNCGGIPGEAWSHETWCNTKKERTMQTDFATQEKIREEIEFALAKRGAPFIEVYGHTIWDFLEIPEVGTEGV